MTKQRRSGTPFPAMAGLVKLASALHPDASILRASARYCELWDEVGALYRAQPKGYTNRCRATSQEREDLLAFLTRAEAQTPEGRIAKAKAVLNTLGKGTYDQFTRSLVRDFLNADGEVDL